MSKPLLYQASASLVTGNYSRTYKHLLPLPSHSEDKTLGKLLP